ncbi:MAG: prepilin-type N-terminal cleavage/methylation domain-containing protein [Myxococcota bacterium]|nr:prepilin-type N-terminal cleavage/methylation domain-containing protein [Myxococcota bacterium]
MARQPIHDNRAIGPHRPKGLGAFTLLEVLAAVAILSIWYVVIAAMATEGLRKQGISNRLIEASEIASQVMAEIEAGTLNGSAPESRDEETEEGIFLVHVFIAPFGFGSSSAAEDYAQEEQDGPGLEQLVKAEMPGVAQNLMAINVRVAWEEGPAVRAVRRRTYAFDLESAIKVYESGEAQDADAADEERRQDKQDAEEIFEELE